MLHLKELLHNFQIHPISITKPSAGSIPAANKNGRNLFLPLKAKKDRRCGNDSLA